jgi:CsoR family transcriptional regulator, copper-sensing transcriptional repressor
VKRQQSAAASSLGELRAATGRAEEIVVAGAHCVERAIASGSAAEQRRKIAELMDVVGRADR